ncbi:MAG: hypothetical protein VX519_10055 [Myxococcota bacterium]|nr:hypothetical protein [Myxococcota bacterium]
MWGCSASEAPPPAVPLTVPTEVDLLPAVVPPAIAPDSSPAARFMYRTDAEVRGAVNAGAITWLILEGPGITDAAMLEFGRFTAVNRLTLRSTNVTDAGLMHLQKLGKLGKLKFSDNPGLTEAGMGFIADVRSLYWLDFESQVLTVPGLARLGSMPGLRRLHLAYRDGVAPVLPNLEQFQGLERLYIQSPLMTDAHLKALEGPSRVFVLDLSGSPIDGSGLKFLSGFTLMRELYLRHTRLGDAGLAYLPELPFLQVLDLHGTPLGDAGLEGLDGCRRFQNVYLGDTQVSAQAEARFQKRCPQMKIHRSGGSPRGEVP